MNLALIALVIILIGISMVSPTFGLVLFVGFALGLLAEYCKGKVKE